MVRKVLSVFILSIIGLGCKVNTSIEGESSSDSSKDLKDPPVIVIGNIDSLSPASGASEIVSSMAEQVEDYSGSFVLDNDNAESPTCADNGVLTINSDSGVITFDPDGLFTGTCHILILFESEELSSPAQAEISVDIIAVNSITVSNLQTASLNVDEFDVSLDFTGDDNADANALLYYCNETDNGGCNPLAEIPSAMTRSGNQFTHNVSGLSSPDDPGDDFNIAVVVIDTDGVTGSPLNGTVTLSTGLDFVVTSLKYDHKGATRSNVKLAMFFTGDSNSNATVTLNYCNRTADPTCNPMTGTSVVMPLGTDFWGGPAHIVDLDLSVHSAGDAFLGTAVINDPDGVTGSPINIDFNKAIGFDHHPIKSGSYTSLPNNNLDVVKFDGTNIYVGSDMGVSISSDGGSTWSSSTYYDGLGSFNVQDLLVNGLNIYVSTFARAYESNDGGATYHQIASTQNGLSNNSVAALWVNGSKYYAARGFAFSNDSSANYVSKNTGLPSSNVQDIYGVGSAIYVATSGGLAVTADDGDSYTTYTTGNSTIPHNDVEAVHVDSGNIYLATRGGLSISPDGGTTWNNHVSPNIAHNTVLDVYANGPNIYLATSGGISMSGNSGTNWTNFTTAQGLASNNTRSIAVVGATYYVATDAGLSYTTNGGGLWNTISESTNLPASDLKGLVDYGGAIWTGSTSGLHKSVDSGLTWTTYNTGSGMPHNTVNEVVEYNGTIWAATDGGITATTNGSSFTNWTTTEGLLGNTVEDIVVDASGIYAATTSGLSISPDHGATWTDKTTVEGLVGNNQRGVHVDGLKICVATSAGLSVSEDGGGTWSNYTTTEGLATNNLRGVWCSGNDIFIPAQNGLLVSYDNGTTWLRRRTSDGLNWNSGNWVTKVGNVLYVNSNGALCISWDNGVTFLNHFGSNTGHSGGPYGMFIHGGTGKMWTTGYGGLNVEL